MKNKNTVIKNQVILSSTQDLQRLSFLLVNNLRGRSRIKYGMTTLFNNGGFTLIELLVVVLIIGILAAVAVPQYQFAVLKARTIKAIPLLNSMEKAQNIYYLQHGEYTRDRQALDLQSSIVAGYGANFAAYGRIEVDNSLILQWVWNRQAPWNHQCIAYSPVAHRVCQSLGGEEAYSPGVGNHYKLP